MRVRQSTVCWIRHGRMHSKDWKNTQSLMRSPGGMLNTSPGCLESQREAQLPLPQAERVAAHSRQLSDVRAALEWSFGPRGDAEIATRLAVPATQLLLELSLLTECQLWSERAIALLGSQHPDSRP